MMKIKFVFVGRVKEKYFAEAIKEYKKRLSAFAEVAVVEIKEEPCDDPALVPRCLFTEGERIAAELRGRTICLAVEGKKFSSENLAQKLGEYRDRGEELTFVVGGSNGIDPSIKKRAELISFSDMTFPHSLARVMLFEQLYRAFSILAGSKYHK